MVNSGEVIKKPGIASILVPDTGRKFISWKEMIYAWHRMLALETLPDHASAATHVRRVSLSCWAWLSLPSVT